MSTEALLEEGRGARRRAAAVAAAIALVFVVLTGGGCGAPERKPAALAMSGKSDVQQEFEKLYKEYSRRFHDRMIEKAEALKPVEIVAEAARTWDEVFGPRKDLVRRRAVEILNELDPAQPVQEDLYLKVASGSPIQPSPDQPQGVVLKQFLWSPVGTAQMGLNNWLVRLLQSSSFAKRSVMAANAPLFWEAIDRNPDAPKLILRQGPMFFIVQLSRQDDYYQVERVRWLRLKLMGPITTPPRPDKAEDGSGDAQQ